MPHDPAITTDDLLQEFAAGIRSLGECVSPVTFVARRRIDAARQYTRRLKRPGYWPLPNRVDPVNQLILKERTKIIRDVLRHATPAQRNVAELIMDGATPSQIAKQLGRTRGAITRILHRLRPLFKRLNN